MRMSIRSVYRLDNAKHLQGKNSDNGGDNQQLNQSETVPIEPSHFDWTVA